MKELWCEGPTSRENPRLSVDMLKEGRHFPYMNGREVFKNAVRRFPEVIQEALDTIILMLSPVVPHFSHTLWNHLGHTGAVIDANWPILDKSALTQEQILIVLQVNGKVRAKIEVAKDLGQQALEGIASNHESITKYTNGKTVRKIIVVPGRLVNIVVA